MRIPTLRFDHDVILYNVGDVHAGNPQCKRGLVDKVVDAIADDYRARFFTSGDWLEVGTKESKSDCYKASTVHDERKWITSKFERVKDKGLFLLRGNHEDRIWKLTGDDVMDVISDKLGIPYHGSVSRYCIVCGRASYYIATSHGKGNGSTDGAKLESIKKFARIYPGFDLYCQGHSHSFVTKSGKQHILDKKRGLCGYMTPTFSVTGHFLEYEESYAQDGLLEPQPEGCAKITLHACGSGNLDRKRIDVELFN